MLDSSCTAVAVTETCSPGESPIDNVYSASSRRHFSQDSLFVPCENPRTQMRQQRFFSDSSPQEATNGSWPSSDESDHPLNSQSKLDSDVDDVGGTQLSQSLTSGLSHLTVVAASVLREKTPKQPVTKEITDPEPTAELRNV